MIITAILLFALLTYVFFTTPVEIKESYHPFKEITNSEQIYDYNISAYRPTAKVYSSNDTLVSMYDYFKYGTKNLSALLVSLYNYSISFHVKVKPFSFGYYVLWLNVGNLRLGIYHSSTTGINIYYGNEDTGIVVVPTYAIAREYTITFNINQNNGTVLVRLTIPDVAFGHDGKGVMIIPLGNYVSLINGEVSNWTLNYRTYDSDIHTIVISDFEISYEKSYPYGNAWIFALSLSIFIFVIGALYYENPSTITSKYMLLAILFLTILSQIPKPFVDTRMLFMFSLVGIWATLYYFKGKSYSGEDRTSLLILGMFILVMAVILAGAGGVVASGHGNVFEFSESAGISVIGNTISITLLALLITTVITDLLSAKHLFFTYVKILVLEMVLVGYVQMWFGDIILTVGVGIFTLLAGILLSSDELHMSEFWKGVLSLTLFSEAVLFAILFFF